MAQVLSLSDFKQFTSRLNPEDTYDNSSLDVFMTCPQKFWYENEFHISSPKEDPALTWGSAAHEAIFHHMSGHDLDTCLKAFILRCKIPGTNIDKELETKTGSKQKYSLEYGVWLMSKYIKDHPLKHEPWEVVKDTNGKPYLELGFAIDAGVGVFVGRIDAILRMLDSGDIWIMDHKTTQRNINDVYWSQFNPNNQITGYLWAVQELLGVVPKGCIINCVRNYQFARGDLGLLGQKVFARSPTYRHKKQIDYRASEIKWMMQLIKMFRKKGQSAFYRNAPTACNAYFKRCAFAELCLCYDKEMAKQIAYANYKQRSWVAYDELETTKRQAIIKVA